MLGLFIQSLSLKQIANFASCPADFASRKINVALSLPGYRRDTLVWPGCDTSTSGTAKGEYCGLENLKVVGKGSGLKFQAAEFSNSTVGWPRVFPPPGCFFLPFPVSHRCNPVTHLASFPSFLSRQRHLVGRWGSWGALVTDAICVSYLWPKWTTQMWSRGISLPPILLITSAGRCRQQSRRADGAGSGGSATDTPWGRVAAWRGRRWQPWHRLWS